MTDRAFNAIFTPDVVRIQTDVRGRPYVRARGRIENSNRVIERTVIARGKGYDALAAVLEPGATVKIRGFYQRVHRTDGTEGGEFFSAFKLLQRFSDPEPKGNPEPTGRTVTGHERKGYSRRQWYGPGRTLCKWVTIAPTRVKGGRSAA